MFREFFFLIKRLLHVGRKIASLLIAPDTQFFLDADFLIPCIRFFSSLRFTVLKPRKLELRCLYIGLLHVSLHAPVLTDTNSANGRALLCAFQTPRRSKQRKRDNTVLVLFLWHPFYTFIYFP